MHKLNKPSDRDIPSHYNDCLTDLQIRKNKNEEDAEYNTRCRQFEIAKQKAINLISDIASSANEYHANAKDAKLYELTKLNLEQDIIKHEIFQKLYKQRFYGKEIYNKIMADARKLGFCPYCSANSIKDMDHFLPQNLSNGFPEFSILPINLVPACPYCNEAKLAIVSSLPEEQFVHPYYENINTRWLYASITYEDGEPIFCFYVKYSDDEIKRQRLEFQFKTLKLQELYKENAEVEYNNMKASWVDLRKKNSTGLQEEILEKAESCAKYNQNSWKTAMYYALAEDKRFYKL